MFTLIEGIGKVNDPFAYYAVKPFCSCNFGSAATCSFNSSCSFTGGQCSFNNQGSVCSPMS